MYLHRPDRVGRVADAVATPGARLAQCREQRKLVVIERRRPNQFAAEPGHALRHIHGEADARLLAVADDIDPGIELAGQHVGHRGRALAPQESLVDLFSRLLAQQQVRQMRRPRQAAAMGREDSLVAAQHGRPILCLLFAALNRPGGYSPSR